MKFQMLGSADKPGPVRLSDVYNSQVGDASMGIAASQKALYDAYNSLNSSKANQSWVTTQINNLTKLSKMDNRNVAQTPKYYNDRWNSDKIAITVDLVYSNKIGITGTGVATYTCLLTFCTWQDTSGNSPAQIAITGSKLMTRIGSNDTTWTAWSDH